MSVTTRSGSTGSVITRTLGKSSANESLLGRLYDRDPERYPCLLASTAQDSGLGRRQTRDARVKQGSHDSRYDILFAFPQYSLTLNADRSLSYSASLDDHPPVDSFFEALEALYLKHVDVVVDGHDLPFYGGWFVYLSYEMAMEVEPCLDLPVDPSQPLAYASRHVCALIHDHHTDELIAVAESGCEQLLDEIEQDYVSVVSDAVRSTETVEPLTIKSLLESDAQPYLDQVERIKRYIIDGDIFQANLSRLWQAELKGEVSDYDVLMRLARSNPSSFAAMVRIPGQSIISSSPERLVCCRNGIIETRPIAGTRPRAGDAEADARLAEELIAHPKERAEHIMLIDLERNDLGRVCKAGSVEVDELMVLETWQHVHHIVSNVRGELAEGKSPVDVLRAVFPGGTITGCPKVRCIEILAEMEARARGPYTGSLGYINRDGSMDFNILIRTLVRSQDTGSDDVNADMSGGISANRGDKISFRAGGGIVSDSIAEKELAETRAKAKGLLRIFKGYDEESDRT